MFNSTILDVAIALAFTYLLLALLCTTLNEWMAGILKTRGKMLEEGIQKMLGDQPLDGTTFAAVFNQHPLIGSLRRDPKTPPSYMAPRTFALAIMDLVTSPGSITFADLEKGIQELPPGSVKTSLLAVIQNANGDLPAAQKGIEDWFNDAMDRVTGWYTRRKQVTSIFFAVIVTPFVNADTLTIANKLWINPALRQEVVDRAKSGGEEAQKLISATYPSADPLSPHVTQPPGSALTTAGRLQSQLGDLTGWGQEYKDDNEDLGEVIGRVLSPCARLDSHHHRGFFRRALLVRRPQPFHEHSAAGTSPAEEGKGPRKDTSGSGQ